MADPLLNFSAEFDTVDHWILLRRLHKPVKIDRAVLKWFESYLDRRSVRVCVDDQFSQEATVDCEVPQGSFFAPPPRNNYRTQCH